MLEVIALRRRVFSCLALRPSQLQCFCSLALVALVSGGAVRYVCNAYKRSIWSMAGTKNVEMQSLARLHARVCGASVV